MTRTLKVAARMITLVSAILILPNAWAQSASENAPIRFFPEVFEPADRMTLTPGFSPDGSTIFFSQTDCLPIWECPQRLKRSDWNGSTWTKPVRVPLPVDARVDYPSVTPDGKTLLFSWQVPRYDLEGFDVDGNFDLWQLSLDQPDAVPEPMMGPDLARVRAGRVRTLRFVNNETAPILTKDGDLYFWSERLDAVGERDVFVAKANGAGGFKAPIALPSPINSTSRDNASWVSADGRTMLIVYSDRGGCGGGDLFISYRGNDGIWTEPENLGCSINSPYNDGGGVLRPDTGDIVFLSDRPDGILENQVVQWWTAPFNLDSLAIFSEDN